MATTSPTLNPQPLSQAPAGLLISLPSLPHEAMEALFANLAQAFSSNVVVASPDASAWAGSATPLPLVGYTPAAPPSATWTLTAADFLNAHELVREHAAGGVLLLGPEAQSLEPRALKAMGDMVLSGRTDLAVPLYNLPPHSGLVNSAILYPISKALFGAAPRFPLALDLGMSTRMTERLATTAQRFTAASQYDALLWPVAEAALAGFSIAQTEPVERIIPQPSAPDLNALLAHVAGSLFTDVDAKAAFWQRSRVAPPVRPSTASSPGGTDSPLHDEIASMIEAFRNAYVNLSEIWSLVLPPHSLLGLKRLSVLPAETFRMPESLWARIMYDFVLAFRLRTINRGHLLGALTPLYLAWVASYILQTGAGANPERLVEAQAAAFEADKAYLVSRWRWPDRFNP